MCYCCGKPGHTAHVCGFKDAQCHSCGKKGHIARVCKKGKTNNSRPPGSYSTKWVEKETARAAATQEHPNEASSVTTDKMLWNVSGLPRSLEVNKQPLTWR